MVRDQAASGVAGAMDVGQETFSVILYERPEGTRRALMDTIVRIVVILTLIAFSLFRLMRYFRHAVSKRVTAMPPAAGMPLLETPAEPRVVASASSSVRETGSVRFMAGLLTLVVWMGGNALLSAALFAVPALWSIPVIWRLFVLIFANFYLFPFAKRVGEDRYRRTRGEAAQSGSPFGN